VILRLIFRRYLELGAVNALVRDLRERSIRTKERLLATGTTRGGVLFGRGSLFYLLRNRFYIGEVKYKDEILPGEQPAIMDRALFDAVQQRLCRPLPTKPPLEGRFLTNASLYGVDYPLPLLCLGFTTNAAQQIILVFDGADRHLIVGGAGRRGYVASPQNGFSTLIRRINTRSSVSICGRPPSGRDFQRQ
jgi:hypothetical protein